MVVFYNRPEELLYCAKVTVSDVLKELVMDKHVFFLKYGFAVKVKNT